MLGAGTQRNARSQLQNQTAVNLFVVMVQVVAMVTGLHHIIRLYAGVNQDIIIREGRPIKQVKVSYGTL